MNVKYSGNNSDSDSKKDYDNKDTEYEDDDEEEDNEKVDEDEEEQVYEVGGNEEQDVEDDEEEEDGEDDKEEVLEQSMMDHDQNISKHSVDTAKFSTEDEDVFKSICGGNLMKKLAESK